MIPNQHGRDHPNGRWIQIFLQIVFKGNWRPIVYIHFTTEGQVAFKSVLFVPMSAPHALFNEYGFRKSSYIKLCIAEHSSQMTSMMWCPSTLILPKVWIQRIPPQCFSRELRKLLFSNINCSRWQGSFSIKLYTWSGRLLMGSAMRLLGMSSAPI